MPHGFRASFSTWASEKNGFNDNVIEASLAHVVGGVRGAYKRNPNGDYLLDARRELMTVWADFVTTPVPTAATRSPSGPVRRGTPGAEIPEPGITSARRPARA